MKISDLILGTWIVTPVPKDGRACTVEGDGGREIGVIASLDSIVGLMVTARIMRPTKDGGLAHLSSLSKNEEISVLARMKYPERLRAFPGSRWIDMSVAEVLRDLKD